MKIVVYAICKNEEKFVERWIASMTEADEVIVLDTGSTDGTVEKLRAGGAAVFEEIISPWRFDTARNRALELVPKDTDICVCTDMDEVFETGWRNLLEKAWTPETGQAAYRYTWSFNPDGSEGVVFWSEKIHARHGYSWVHPVHEVLKWTGEGNGGKKITVEGIQLNHYPDPDKSRGQYLPLLEQAVLEDPEDDRNVHYLGREYMFYKRWQECIRTLQYHLTMKKATWKDERCASMRYIARSFLALGREEEAEIWYLRAVAEAPHLREPWLEYARMAYEKKSWYLLVWLTERALSITERPRTYISEAESWGSMPYDLASLGYYYTGKYDMSLEHIEKALAFSPKDQRLIENRRIILQTIK